MKELLAALAAFGQNPEAVGDNLFTLFSAITSMTFEEATAAGCAIYALQDEAYKSAKARDEKTALDDPTYNRLRSVLAPVVVRVGQLIAQAPKEQQGMLIESVQYRFGQGFVSSSKTDAWRKELGIEKK